LPFHRIRFNCPIRRGCSRSDLPRLNGWEIGLVTLITRNWTVVICGMIMGWNGSRFVKAGLDPRHGASRFVLPLWGHQGLAGVSRITRYFSGRPRILSIQRRSIEWRFFGGGRSSHFRVAPGQRKVCFKHLLFDWHYTFVFGRNFRTCHFVGDKSRSFSCQLLIRWCIWDLLILPKRIVFPFKASFAKRYFKMNCSIIASLIKMFRFLWA